MNAPEKSSDRSSNPRPAVRRSDHLRCQEPGHEFPPIYHCGRLKGAPNVLVILIDDAGFGSSSAFGRTLSDAERSSAWRLPKALGTPGSTPRRFARPPGGAPLRPQSPRRGHGWNHRNCHLGAGLQLDPSRRSAAPLAETLKLNGYSTAQFGKCHEVPVWESSPLGPFDSWPSGGGGFEHFYGFIGGETNQYAPAIYQGTVPVEPDRTPEEGYHFTEDMTDHAIDWVHGAKSADAGQAVLRLLRSRRTHAPHHVPAEWSEIQGQI